VTGTPAPALTSALRSLARREDLSSVEMEAAIGEVLSGVVPEVAVAALLTGLRVKGETAEELAGAVTAVRNRVADVGLEVRSAGVLDTCGTGGDGAQTVNISTAAAIVVAACGVPVAKHGNRSASGNSGSAEVLAELGVNVEAETAVLNRCMAELGVTFLFAPKFHPGLRAIAPVRKQLPFRTLFNLVGPLANPARPEYQLLGVAGLAQARLVAGALARLGSKRAAVVTGADGLDEVSLAGPTHVFKVDGGVVSELIWAPEDFGLGRSTPAEIRVSGPSESAALIRRFLAGERGPVRETVVANAAAALWVADEGSALIDSVARASEAIDDGRAARLLARWAAVSTTSPGA
jgi:anthranilate phosphoribosyltransferase